MFMHSGMAGSRCSNDVIWIHLCPSPSFGSSGLTLKAFCPVDDKDELQQIQHDLLPARQPQGEKRVLG